MTRTRWPTADLYSAYSSLAADSGIVIGLRMFKALEDGPTWPAEARLMIEEKTAAAMAAHALFFTSFLTGTSLSAPSRTLAMYRRKVKDNRRRLSGKL